MFARSCGPRMWYSLLAVTFAMTLLASGRPVESDVEEGRQWLTATFVVKQRVDLHRLAEAIQQEGGLPQTSSAQIQNKVRSLSVLQSAGLATVLLDKHSIDPRPWLKLTQDREQAAIREVVKVQRRVGLVEAGYEPIQRTVQGPAHLRDYCGDELLSEVTSVGFWNFYDGGIPAPSSFGDDDVQAVVQLSGLEKVIAPWSELSDEGAIQLAGLPRLRELRIAGAHVSDQLLFKLAENSQMRVIDVEGAECVSDVGVRELARCAGLEQLNLSETGVTSDSLETIGTLDHLRELGLSRTAVRTGLEKLGQLTRLRSLALAGLGRSDLPLEAVDFRFLSQLKQLHTLTLRSTAVDRLVIDDLPELSSLQLGHSILTDLSLTDLPKVRDLRITADYGEQPLSLARLRLDNLPGLGWLAVERLQPRAADGLASGLATMPAIQACYLGGHMSDDLALALSTLEQLQTLSLTAGIVNDAQLAHLSQAPAMTFLRLDGSGLTSDGLGQLSNAPELIRLQLENLRLPRVGFLAQLKQVQFLRLDRCKTDSLNLEIPTGLRRLDIRESDIGRLDLHGSRIEHLSVLGSRFGSVTVSSCPDLGVLFFGGSTSTLRCRIVGCGRLQSVTIQEGSDPGKLSLENLVALKNVSFWAAEVKKQHLQALIGLPVLANLDISGTQLDDDAASVLPKLSTLTHLGASGHFGWRGLQEIGKLPFLRKLNLYHSDRSDWTREQAREYFETVRDVSVF